MFIAKFIDIFEKNLLAIRLNFLNMSNDSNRTFSKLKGRENFDIWKISAKSFLVIKGLWSCVLKEPNANKPEELEKDLKALSEITLLLDENLYSYISSATTAKSAWENLEKSFEDSGLSRKVELLKQLVKLTLADCESVEDYVSKMVTTSLKVEKAGLKIDDEVLASLMLAGLPDEFMSLVMAIENSSKKLSSDAVKTLLLQETRLAVNNNGSGAFYVNSRKTENFKFRCHNCNETGHMARNCVAKRGGKKNGVVNHNNAGSDDENPSYFTKSIAF